jgi:hypothetical protein
MTLMDSELAGLATAAVIAVDIPHGSDIYAESGLRRFIGDCLFTGIPGKPALYSHPLAQEILRLAESGKDYNLQAEQWMLEDGPAYEALTKFKDAAYQENEYRGKFVQNLANALEVLWQMKEVELGLRTIPLDYRHVVKTCVGSELRNLDIKLDREELIKNLMEAGFDPDKYQGNVRNAVQVWEESQGVLTGEAMKNEILRFIPLLAETTRKNVLSNLPYYVRKLPLDNFKVSYLPDAWFMASNNYTGDRKPYESGYEFTAKLKLPSPRIETLTRHEAIPGHHFSAVLKHDQIRKGLLSRVAGVHTMCTPDCSLNEGIANSGALILYGENPNKFLNLDQRIALNLEKLDYMGRVNAVVMRFQDCKTHEEIKNHLVVDCCSTPEMADTIIRRLGMSPIHQAYLPGYGLGAELVQDVLKKFDRGEALKTLYGFNGPVDAITLPEMAEEFCTPI